jgi:hypothetical protein
MIWVLLALSGYWPTRVYCGPRGIQGMLAAQVLVVVVVYVTLVPAIARMATADAPGRLKIGFKAAFARFLFTLALAGLVVWRGDVERQVFLVWVAIAYVVMIKCETFVLVRWAKMLERASCS